MKQSIILFGALFFGSLIVGGQYVVWWDYDPAGMSSTFYTEKMQHAISVIGLPLFSVQCTTALLTIVSAFLARQNRTELKLLLAASACCIVAVLITIFGNIPILKEIETWNIGSPPPSWRDLANKWWWIHSVRTCVQVVGLALVMLSVLRQRIRPV